MQPWTASALTTARHSSSLRRQPETFSSFNNFLTWHGAVEAQEEGAPTDEGAAAAAGASRRAAADERYEIIQSISPAPGLAIIFDHFLFHEGASVEVGFKHIMRSEVVYERLRNDGAAEPTAAAASPPAEE